MRINKKKLGKAFPDQLLITNGTFGKMHRKRLSSLDNTDWEEMLVTGDQGDCSLDTPSVWRHLGIGIVFLIVFFGLFLRLFHLQVALGHENRELADTNRIQIRVLHAPRGVIYDRNNKVLAENNPGFRLEGKFIDRDDALAMEAQSSPYLDKLEIDNVRTYPFGSLTAHVLGYVSQVTAEELQEEKYKNYQSGDRVGRGGLEEAYETELRGKDGAEIIEIDASGYKLRTLRRIEPVAGKNIHVSLDIDLQKISREALKKAINKNKVCCGALVAEDPQNGEILALVSLPEFDGNAFTNPKRNSEVSQYFTNESAPLLNRVIGGTYPPGSTFKITSALSGLSHGKITAQTKIEDTGVMSLGPYTFANWYFTQYGGKEGLVDVVKALQRSNDIYFYQVGDRLGEKLLGETAEKLGFGKKLGIDLPGEVEGLVPTSEWKDETIGEVWYPGDTLHMAIGQGFILTTPLQILSQTAYVANNGEMLKPHLMVKISAPDGRTVKVNDEQVLVKDIFSKNDLSTVKKGLELVPKEGGTAWPFFDFTISTAGKTGTAEFGDPKNKTHAWYTAFAPIDQPKIVATALIEAGGEGSSEAAPVLREVFNWYFNPDKSHIVELTNKALSTNSAKVEGD